MSHRSLVFALVFVAGSLAATAQAQQPDPWEQARWRFGPLAMTPTFTIKNLGVDTNVFNQIAEPKQDFTLAAGPQADWWLRAGRARLHGSDSVEGVYFAKYPSQGGFNQRHQATFELPLNHLRPYVGASYLNTKDRPGYEIDARARHTESGLNAGSVVRLTSRASLDLRASRVDYRFVGDDVFLGSSLAKQLDRRTENYGAAIRARLTPLTTITLSADGVRERFHESPERDNNGYRILFGVEFDPFALIRGKATVGYRTFNALTSGMPDFAGAVWTADLGYTLLGTTRFGVGASRDIQFSYETTEPFYVQTGYTLSVTQAVRGPWDVQARGGRYKLAYSRAGIEQSTSASRIDDYNTWGGGLGYRVGTTTTVRLNADHYRRGSARVGRDYQGLRIGLAATYDF